MRQGCVKDALMAFSTFEFESAKTTESELRKDIWQYCVILTIVASYSHVAIIKRSVLVLVKSKYFWKE